MERDEEKRENSQTVMFVNLLKSLFSAVRAYLTGCPSSPVLRLCSHHQNKNYENNDYANSIQHQIP